MNPSRQAGAGPESMDWPARLRSAANLANLLARTLAVSVEVFLHRRLGSRAIGIEGACVIPLIMIYCLFWPEDDLEPMMWFLGGFICMTALARASGLVRRWRGTEFHTRYTGLPWLMLIFTRTKELTVKRFLEPVFMFGLGGVTICVNPPLGWYLVFTGGGLAVSVLISEMHQQTRLMDMRDAAAEQRDLLERFRRVEEARRRPDPWSADGRSNCRVR